jgi:hypothetical protein
VSKTSRPHTRYCHSPKLGRHPVRVALNRAVWDESLRLKPRETRPIVVPAYYYYTIVPILRVVAAQDPPSALAD